MAKSITIKLTDSQRKKLRQVTGEDQAEVKFEAPGLSSRVAPRGRKTLRGSGRVSLRGRKTLRGSGRVSLRGRKTLRGSGRVSLRGRKTLRAINKG
jgi:hypothetical protein